MAQETDSLLVDTTEVSSPMQEYVVEDEEVSAEENKSVINDIAEADKLAVQSRHLDTTAVNKLKKDKAFWYVNEKPAEKKVKKNTPSIGRVFNGKWFTFILWTIIIGSFLGILIWFLAASDVKFFTRKKKLLLVQEEEVDMENIFEINYEKEIEKAIAAGNFRLATRLLYLKLLKRMSEANIIQYKQGRTNSDYVLQLYGTAWYADFFRLTRNFEYAWYGEFRLSEDAFGVIRKDFTNFNQRIA